MGADPLMGDGAGIMVQIPHDFFVKEMAKQGITLPAPGLYAVAHIFFPQDPDLRLKMERVVEKVIEPIAVDNEEEGYGRNAGSRRHYYRVAFPMKEIWPAYVGSPRDGLYIEIFESWLERTDR